MAESRYMSYSEWRKNEMKKEHEKMNLEEMNNVTVNVGRQTYRVFDMDYIQTAGEFPRLRLNVDLSPFNRTSFRQLVDRPRDPFAIKKVHFNPPATVVLWEDGTKTVVKTQNGEDYDAEKGLAMAIAKKALGNKGSYFNEIKKHTEPFYEDVEKFKRFIGTEYHYSDFIHMLMSNVFKEAKSNGPEST